MIKITKEIKRDMAHRLPDYQWKCFNVHWHTYKALITVSWNIQKWWAEDWMVMDFNWFNKIKNWIDENRDHSYVWRNDDEVLKFLKEHKFRTFEFDFSPTAENMSEYLFNMVKWLLPDFLEVENITIYETPTSFSTYSK